MAHANAAKPTLFQDGWRQGTVFHVRLPIHTVGLGADDSVVATEIQHSSWVIASQDCDLAGVHVDDDAAVVEVRAVLDEDPPQDWGVRSRKLRLDVARYVKAGIAPAFVSPSLLARLAREGREDPLPEGRAIALKTWLGLRFDRPAVPEHLVPLASDVAKRVRRPGGRLTAEAVHDVLMQFDDSADPTRVALFAVIEPDADREEVRRWLAEVARAIPTELGVVVEIDVGTKAETSLELIETSYAADASQISWRGPEPEGAV